MFGTNVRNIFCSKKLFRLRRRSVVSSRWESSNVNEVIRAISNPLIFFYEKILQAENAQKAQKSHKAQNAYKRTKTKKAMF